MAKKQDEQFASSLPGVVRYHSRMLSDGVRNDLLYRAIKRVVTRETHFMDVGAGTGMWAILAAKLGARRVVAVEVREALIPIIAKHAEENNVAGRVEIIQGNIDKVKLRERFDVIVCELFGKDIFGPSMVRSFIDLRKRFLAPQGVLIPQKLEICAAPVISAQGIRNLPSRLDLKAAFFNELKLNYPEEVQVSDGLDLNFAALPQKLFEIDFRTVTDPLKTTEYSAIFKLSNISRVHSFAVFSRSVFSDRYSLDAVDSQSWNFVKYNFEPFKVKAGEIQFALNTDPLNGSWSVSIPSRPNERQRTYSPVFGFARIKMAQAAVPQETLRPVTKK